MKEGNVDSLNEEAILTLFYRAENMRIVHQNVMTMARRKSVVLTANFSYC